jgi:hypothetical protein
MVGSNGERGSCMLATMRGKNAIRGEMRCGDEGDFLLSNGMRNEVKVRKI